MLAMNYRGPFRVRATQKPIPEILHPSDAIVRVTRSCICGSDLHLYHGLVPDTRVGMTFGHEFIGIVEEIGSSVQNLRLATTSSFPLISPAESVPSVSRGSLAIATNRTRKRRPLAAYLAIRTRRVATTVARPNLSGCLMPM